MSSALLALMVIVFVALFRKVTRWLQAMGVQDTAARWVLACIVPSALLLASVHLPAVYSLLFGGAWVTLGVVSIVFGVLATASWLWFGAPRPTESPEAPRSIPVQATKVPLVPVALLVAMYAVFAVDAATRFPSGCDGLHYHLPVAVQWMQNARLDLIPGLKHQSFPENGMIISFLLLSAGWERLVNFAQLPAAILVGLCVYGLSNAAGATRRGSIMAACVALSIPIVSFQAFSTYIDLFAAASWLMSLLTLIAAYSSPSRRAFRTLIALAGMAAGIALGSKTTYLALVPPLIVATAGVAWVRWPGDRHRLSTAVRAATMFAAAMFVCSAFWFVRGAVQAGNPVYPLAIEVGGVKVLPGFTADESPHFPRRTLTQKIHRWWDYPWRETKYSGTGYRYGVNNGLGAAFATFVPLGCVVAVGGLFHRTGKARPQGWRVLMLGFVLCGVVLHLTLFREMLRFVLPLVILATALCGPIVDTLFQWHPRVGHVLAATALAVTAAVACLKPAHALAGRLRDGSWDRHTFYGTPPIIDEFAAGTHVLNLSSAYATYPLYGSQKHVNVLTPLHWEMLTGAQIVTAAALAEHEIDYVYVRAAWKTHWPEKLPIELVCDTADPAVNLFGPSRHLYRVLHDDVHVMESKSATDNGPVGIDTLRPVCQGVACGR